MSTNPEVVEWMQPSIYHVEETGNTILALGSVAVPPGVDPDTAERVLAVVIELVTQMIEEDILPEFLKPSLDDD
jgi:hypothetical protein